MCRQADQILLEDMQQKFWNYSLSIYSNERFRTACLTLQDDIEADVNVLIFISWFSLKTRSELNINELKDLISKSQSQRLWVIEYRKFRKIFCDSVMKETNKTASENKALTESQRKNIKQSLLNTELLLEAEVQRALLIYAMDNLSFETTHNIKDRTLDQLIEYNMNNYIKSLSHDFTKEGKTIQTIVQVTIEHNF